MDIDNIQLPAFIIHDLYQKTLVDLTESDKVKDKEIANEIKFFGGNNQRILLLINNPGIAFLEDEQFTFLSGILNACKLTMEDIALINIATYSTLSYKKINETFAPKIILMLGVSSASIQLPFVIPEFQQQSYNNQVYLSVFSLNELEKNKDLKRKLWMALQQIFSL